MLQLAVPDRRNAVTNLQMTCVVQKFVYSLMAVCVARDGEAWTVPLPRHCSGRAAIIGAGILHKQRRSRKVSFGQVACSTEYIHLQILSKPRRILSSLVAGDRSVAFISEIVVTRDLLTVFNVLFHFSGDRARNTLII